MEKANGSGGGGGGGEFSGRMNLFPVNISLV